MVVASVKMPYTWRRNEVRHVIRHRPSHRPHRSQGQPGNLAIIRRAAEIQGRSLSDFVITAAQEAAAQAIERAQVIRLSMEDQQAFVDAILRPPPLTPAMERAIERHREVIAETR